MLKLSQWDPWLAALETWAAGVGSKSPPWVVQLIPPSAWYQVTPLFVHWLIPVPSFQLRVTRWTFTVMGASAW